VTAGASSLPRDCWPGERLHVIVTDVCMVAVSCSRLLPRQLLLMISTISRSPT
jgi:hypothetical protein